MQFILSLLILFPFLYIIEDTFQTEKLGLKMTHLVL